ARSARSHSTRALATASACAHTPAMPRTRRSRASTKPGASWRCICPPLDRRGTAMATNRRQQIQLSPDEQPEVFREPKKAPLATIDKDGFPHVVAMNYFALDGAFYMTSYGKAQKVVNVRRNPKMALMIEAGDEYAELRGVMIRGRCEILEDESSVRTAFKARAR